MLRLFKDHCKKAKSLPIDESSVTTADSLSSDSHVQGIYKGYMFLRSPDSWGELDINEFLDGSKDKQIQDAYLHAKDVLFEDQTRPSYNPKYKIYPDLLSLKKTRSGKTDIGIADKGAYILCFNESLELVYEKIAAGNFHKSISKVINYSDFRSNNLLKELPSTAYVHKT